MQLGTVKTGDQEPKARLVQRVQGTRVSYYNFTSLDYLSHQPNAHATVHATAYLDGVARAPAPSFVKTDCNLRRGVAVGKLPIAICWLSSPSDMANLTSAKLGFTQQQASYEEILVRRADKSGDGICICTMEDV